MFWKINFRQPSAIDGLLEKEDCSLNELLDEDDVLQECKAQNKKLIDFVCKSDNLQRLVQYVCQEIPEDEDDKVRFKYPHLACEILTADIFTITDALATEDIYLPMLWSFLDKDPPMNPLVGSFVSKVLMMLLTQRTTIFLDYIKKRESFIESFLKHLGTSAIMDLLLQMIIADCGDQNKINLTMWLKEIGIIEKLVDCIHPTAAIDQCINASQAICDMIRISRDNSQVNGPSPLLIALESKETIERLLENMFAVDNPPDWTVVNGILVLLTLLEKKPSTELALGDQSETITLSWEQTIEATLNSVCPRIKCFHALLSRKPLNEPVLFSVGTLDPPLGNMRLRVVQLFSTLLQSQDIKIHREIIRHRTCAMLLDLFFKYPWNNFLHTYVETSITAILTFNNGASVPLDTNDDTGQPNDSITLRQHLLKECELVQRLLAAAEYNDNQLKEDRGCRQGYMGHLIRMANQVAGNTQALTLNPGPFNVYAKERPSKDLLHEELDKETFEKWNEFISGTVSDMNKRNSTNLGGNRPINSSIEDSDEEFDPLNIAPDNELEKAFQQYQDIHFSSHLVEEYGTDDLLEPTPTHYASTYANITSIMCSINYNEDHTQHMAAFDDVYTDRIHQFDDDDSDSEDESSTWVDKDFSVATPNDPHSSSGDEGDLFKGKRGAGGSSDEDDVTGARKKRDRSPLIIEEKKSDNSNDLGEISWRSDVDENWADFSHFTPQHSNTTPTAPTAVTTTYVSVTGLEEGGGSGNHYVRLPGSSDSDDIVMDPNLVELGGHLSSGSSDDGNSSDDERSASYLVNSGDSGNPLLDPTSPSTDSNSARHPKIDNEDDAELAENYRFLTSKGLMSEVITDKDTSGDSKPQQTDIDVVTPPSDS